MLFFHAAMPRHALEQMSACSEVHASDYVISPSHYATCRHNLLLKSFLICVSQMPQFSSGDKVCDTVLLVEDEPLTATLIQTAVSSGAGLEVLTAQSVGVAEKILRDSKIGLVVLDLNIGDQDGWILMDRGAAALSIKWIILTNRMDEATVLESMRRNVPAFLYKQQTTDTVLINAIVEVVSGRTYFSEAYLAISGRIAKRQISWHVRLTDTEFTLLPFLARGLSDDEVGIATARSSATIRTHRHNILSKLGLQSTAKLIIWSVQRGFLRKSHIDIAETYPPSEDVSSKLR